MLLQAVTHTEVSLSGVTVRCHCQVSLSGVTVRCHCQVSLSGVTVTGLAGKKDLSGISQQWAKLGF